MSDTLITIIVILSAAILMFIFPLMAISGQNDELSQVAVQTLVSEFANDVATSGEITQARYDKFIQQLYSIGLNTYEVEMEVQILDENIGKKAFVTSQDLIGENQYYSIYTTTIEKDINSEEKKQYTLKKGDNFIISVKNTNITMGTQMKNFFYKIAGKDTYVIGASASVLIINNGTLNATS